MHTIEADYLVVAAGSEHPTWKHPWMGMSYNGLIDQLIVAYGSWPEGAVGAKAVGQHIPEPYSIPGILLGLSGLVILSIRRRRSDT